MNTPAKRIAALRQEINFHNRKYYDESRPTISDRDYDRLMQELIELEQAHPELITLESPTQRVGGDVQKELKSVSHAVPMMSIDNTYNESDVRKFDKRVRDGLDGEQPAYVLEPKIDGTSLSLRYINGTLVLGATRGRGNVGEDVTVNARTIRSIPLSLRNERENDAPPQTLEVRGEVYIDNADFQRINKEVEAKGEEPYANARNLTSGTLRRLDSKIVAAMPLRFLAHGLGQVEPMPATAYWQWIQLLRKWGFPLPEETYRVDSIDEALSRIHEFEKVRPKLPYMTDGMVVKVDSFAQRERLGATSKAPRWVVAYKYETEQQPTLLKNVRWQVGKGGNLTPVGELEPVFIGGVTVTNVTLHNIDQIRRLDLHLLDTVIVERAGEVIPYVADILPEKRPLSAEKIEAPKQCPSCHELVEHQLGSPQIRCTNQHCPGQLRERLIWFVGRGQMEIDGLGEKIIDQLIENKLVATFADIFQIRQEQLAALTHETTIGKKRATAIIEAIAASADKWKLLKDAEEEHLQSSHSLKSHVLWLAESPQLDLKGLGERTIEQLVAAGLLRTSEDLFKLTVDQLASLPQQVKVGDKTAKRIVDNAEKAKSWGLARVLASLGIRLVGATAARLFAEWAGNIDVLKNSSVEELAEVLAKAPDKRKLLVAKERLIADSFHASLHQSQQQELFDDESPRIEPNGDQSTESFLKQCDEKLPRKNRLGKSRIKTISECFPTPIDLHTATANELFECLLEGAAVARSLHDYLHSAQGIRVIQELKSVGVDFTQTVAKKTDSEWTGKTVVITGSFEGFSRDKIKEQLISLGAKVAESVSSKTDVVFVGEEPGSKRDKAVALGIKMEGADVIRALMESN